MDQSTLDPMISLDQRARDRIRLWIQTTATTQTELASRIGRTQAWLSRYLRAEFDADLETLQAIARAFGHTLLALLDVPQHDPGEQRMLELYRALPVKSRRKFVDLLESLQPPPSSRIP